MFQDDTPYLIRTYAPKAQDEQRSVIRHMPPAVAAGTSPRRYARSTYSDLEDKALPGPMAKPERTSRHRLSRHQVIWLVVASQIALIGGLFVWGFCLASGATASPPAAAPAAITTWVSARGWKVAPSLTIDGNLSELALINSEPGNALAPPLDVQVVVVLWGNAQLTDLHLDCASLVAELDCHRPLSTAHYQQLQVPKVQALNYVGSNFPGPTVPAQVFRVPLRTDDFASVFPLVGQMSSSLYARTSTGWTVYVPTIAPPAFGKPGSCSSAPAPLPAAIAAAIGSNQQGWYGAPCPAPRVELQTGADEHFSDSTQQPTIEGNVVQLWTNEPQTSKKILDPIVGNFWIDVADPDIAAGAQRDLLFAGVLYGIAGGVLATWLTTAATVAVKRWSSPRATPAGTGTDAVGGGGADAVKLTHEQ